MDASFDYVRRIVPATETHFVVSGPWTPASLGSALQAWYKSDVGVSLSGSNVTRWADQSGNSRDFTVSFGTPTFNATGFNGSYPAIVFGNTTDGLISSVFNIASNTASFFMVCNISNSFGTDTRMLAYYDPAFGDYNGAHTILAFDSHASGVVQAFSTANFATLSVNAADGSNARLGLVLDNVNATIYNNNLQGDQQLASYTIGDVNFVLAVGENNSGGGANMSVVEIVMTNSALTSGNRTSIDNYFKSKWGL